MGDRQDVRAGSACSRRCRARSSTRSASGVRGARRPATSARSSSAVSFVAAVIARSSRCRASARRSARSCAVALGPARRRTGVDAQLGAARRPAERLHGARGERRLDAHPPLLGRLHGGRPRLQPLLRLPELLRLLDAAARPGRATSSCSSSGGRSSARRRTCSSRSGSAATTATSARHQGLRHQRPRRRRPRARHVLHLPAAPGRWTSSTRSSGSARSRAERPDLVAGCILLLVGAFAKSAQVPLHTWLADAMEGPTPVSALIHAATMVTAGVYLIARMWPLFERHAGRGRRRRDHRLPDAASSPRRSRCRDRPQARHRLLDDVPDRLHDHGGVSSGAYVAGLFHLMTHAFFKALLFMAAGSVIAAMADVQNLDRMGGFRRSMPFTFGCFVVGGLALAGVPPFSGFFSKDEILAYVAARGDWHVVARRRRLRRRVHDRRLHVPDDLPRVLRRAGPGGARARGRPPRTTPTCTTNPVTGEEEDTDVGFPGPDHHIAEQALADEGRDGRARAAARSSAASCRSPASPR